jgi:hypothetical protein
LPRLNRLLAGYRLWIHLDLARNELQAMTAFEGAIHIQTRASVAPMQALAGGFTAFCRSHAAAFCGVRKESTGTGTACAAGYAGFVHRFQSAGNMRYDHGAQTFDAREEAMRWRRPVTGWSIPRREFLSERGISRPG